MVVMRCISVQQIVRSDIQAGRKILQQLNRAAPASRFNFCKMVRTNVQHYTQLFLCNPLLFPQIADTSAEFFCIKSHCSILSFAPKTQTGRDSFSESRPVFSLKIQIRLYFTKTNLLINYHRVFFPSSPFLRRNVTNSHNKLTRMNICTRITHISL